MQALYNKYRPTKWADVTEQYAIKQVLDEELKTKNFKRVLMFTGPAGCGKTTSARIYANEIEPIKQNIIEINCADNTGVDDMRRLVLDQCTTKPLQGNYKIFVLDECHALTVQAQSGLLKVLEEPPAYCIFILCTTDPQKVLSTILSRVFRYDFQLISFNGIYDRLQYILNAEKQDTNDSCGIETWENDAISYIAQVSGGHMRNAIALLDKCVSYTKNITVKDVVNVLGVTDFSSLFNILDAIIHKDTNRLIQSVDELVKSGMDLKLFIKNFLSFVLDVNKYLIIQSQASSLDTSKYINIPLTELTKLAQYNQSHKEQLKHLLTTLLELNSSMKWETNVRPVLETNLLMEVI